MNERKIYGFPSIKQIKSVPLLYIIIELEI